MATARERENESIQRLESLSTLSTRSIVNNIVPSSTDKLQKRNNNDKKIRKHRKLNIPRNKFSLETRSNVTTRATVTKERLQGPLTS